MMDLVVAGLMLGIFFLAMLDLVLFHKEIKVPKLTKWERLANEVELAAYESAERKKRTTVYYTI